MLKLFASTFKRST